MNLTEVEFAALCGVSRGSVQQWESGATAPSRRNQPMVAAAMGISVQELMGGAVTSAWPFASVDKAKFEALTRDQKSLIESAIRGMVENFVAHNKATPSGGSSTSHPEHQLKDAA
jgi:transcriptional regulator with XRE-family HTH domain